MNFIYGVDYTLVTIVQPLAIIPMEIQVLLQLTWRTLNKFLHKKKEFSLMGWTQSWGVVV